jgi:hypothetical protein
MPGRRPVPTLGATNTTDREIAMAPIDWTGVLARERIADLRRAAERERLARLARAGGGRIRRGRPVASQRYRARALIAWLWQRLR